MLSKTIRIACATMLAAGVLFGGSALAAPKPEAKPEPAPSAGVMSSFCASGDFCVWYFGGFHEPPSNWHWVGNDADWANNDHEGFDIADDDMSWANNGVPCGGCDHVRVYDNANYSGLTLCVHRGQWMDWDSGGVTLNAANRGRSHRWGGECGAGEPHIPFP